MNYCQFTWTLFSLIYRRSEFAKIRTLRNVRFTIAIDLWRSRVTKPALVQISYVIQGGSLM